MVLFEGTGLRGTVDRCTLGNGALDISGSG